MNGQTYRFAEFSLDTANRQLRRGNETLTLSARAFDLLETLLENKGRLISKDELFSRVWGNQIVEESNLTVHISQIRKSLGETKKNPRFIETVPGFGYRFVGEVSSSDANEIIIETETFSRVTIENEILTKNVEPSNGASRTPRKNRVAYWAAALVGLIILVAFSAFYFVYPKKNVQPFEKIKLSRLTNNGKVSAASISPDGKFMTYVLGETEGNSLWVKQTKAANDTRIVPPIKAEFWGLTFTPDGSQIYYNIFSSDKINPELYRIPTLGGVPQQIPDVFVNSISFSPDGNRFTTVMADSASSQNFLVIADANGANKKTIAKKNQPNTFVFDGNFAVWSPDGETIACLVNHLEAESNYVSIVGVNAKTGEEKPLSSRKWREIRSLRWLKDGSGLIVSASETTSSKNQIWYVPQNDDETRPITDDLNNYSWLGFGANDSLIALQTSSTNSLSIGESNSTAEDFKEIVSEVSALYPVAWTPDGKIIFRSMTDGVSNFWTIEADGTNRRQLTTEAQIDERGMCLTPDGKFVVFVSWKLGKSNLWRMDIDGKNLTKLTDGDADAYPNCTPDGKSVIYQRGILSQPHLWKVSIEGGEPMQITEFRAKWGAVSNDGAQVSFFQMFNDKWHIGFIPSTGGQISNRLAVPPVLKGNKINWAKDNRSLFFIGASGNAGNIWSLPIDNGQPKQITNFKSHYLEDFAWSADKTKIAVSRSNYLSDVVLIESAE